MIRKKLRDIKNIKIKLHSSILDYMGICLIVFLLGYILVFASLNLSIFNPLKQALEDFKMTDLYFELMRSDKEKELNKDIVLVDVTKLTSRDSIAQVITDIHSCSPKVLMIDLIFERKSFDNTEDIGLMNAIEMGKDKEILSAKLTGYKPEKEAFTNLTKSFFHEIADFKWGYSNVSQTRPGGSIRKYSLSQRLNDSISYSMAYLAACAYMGIKPESKDASERLIVYDDTDFLAIECDKVLENASQLQGYPRVCRPAEGQDCHLGNPRGGSRHAHHACGQAVGHEDSGLFDHDVHEPQEDSTHGKVCQSADGIRGLHVLCVGRPTYPSEIHQRNILYSETLLFCRDGVSRVDCIHLVRTLRLRRQSAVFAAGSCVGRRGPVAIFIDCEDIGKAYQMEIHQKVYLL